MRLWLVLGFLAVWQGLALAQTCTQTLSAGANVASTVAAASAGSTICLNTGAYGPQTFGTFTKNPRVTVRSVTGQGASLSLDVRSGSNGVTFDSLTFSGGSDIGGSTTQNITIRNSNFGTNTLWVHTNDFNNNNILIDGNTFGAFDATDCEGRLCVTWGGGPGTVPAGVTVSNNTFGPGGCSDGIQIGSYGVVVGPGNTFTGIVQGSCAAHVDAIQGYGQSHTTVTGNYFTGNSVDLGFYDGGNTEIFTDNVLSHSSANGQAVQNGTCVNCTFEHNTVENATVNFNGKPENGPSQNVLLTNNILTKSSAINFSQGATPSCTSCTSIHNQFDTSGAQSGTDNVIGVPTFVGGTSPSTLAGFQLTSGSVGHNAATDGKDMGTTIFSSAVLVEAPTNLRFLLQ